MLTYYVLSLQLFYKQQLFAAILPELVKTLSKVEERESPTYPCTQDPPLWILIL